MKEKFYLTTAIAYTSQKPHIGNTYEVVFTDALARFYRLIGKDVYFLTGTDEHGKKIMEYAEKAGVSPKEYVDRVSAEVRAVCDLMNTSYDGFIRTTDPYHKKTVSKIFNKLYKQGDIYKSEYSGWYCTPCETFYTESQVEDCKCPDCGAHVEKAKEEAYFFKMSKYQKRLEEYIESHPDFIVPESRKKEMINNFLKPGLQDLCVSRTSFTWGIPVEFDPGHVIYVWIDALSNYITALGYDTEEENKGELFKKFWPCDLHVIGKDILRFHTIYWPIILMALGEELPKQIFGHPWFLMGQDKMSKSKGNVIYADKLVELFGCDAVRFYLLGDMPYANDGNITYENVIKRYNASLANIFGNLVSRTIAMTAKYFGGRVQTSKAPTDGFDAELARCAETSVKNYETKMKECKVAEAIDEIFVLLNRANKYIDETTPWVLAKDETKKERLGEVLYNLVEAIRIAATMLVPVMPETAEKVLCALKCEADWESVQKFGAMKSGTELESLPILFARIDEEELLKKIFEEKEEPKIKHEALPEISIDDFFKTELVAAKVLECEPVEKSDKLLKLILDLGYEKRQVVSGIAKFYKPDDLIGKKVIVVGNLKPAKLRGVESCGMILAGGEEEVKVVFLDDSMPEGTRIR